MAKSARMATKKAINAENERLKKIADKKLLDYTKRVERFFSVEIPKVIKCSTDNRNTSVFIRFAIDNVDGYEEFFMKRAKEILEPLEYKDIKWEFDHFSFNWKE